MKKYLIVTCILVPAISFAQEVVPKEMVTSCSDKITFVGNSPALLWRLGGTGKDAVYETYPPGYTGQVTKVDFVAAKITNNYTVKVAIYAINASTNKPTGTSLGSVNVLVNGALGTYSGTFPSPVNVTNGFAVAIEKISTTDSVNIASSAQSTGGYNNFSFVKSAGTIYSLRDEWTVPTAYDLYFLLSPTIKFNMPVPTITATPSTTCLGNSISCAGSVSATPSHFANFVYNPSSWYKMMDFTDGHTFTSGVSHSNAYAAAGTYMPTYNCIYTGWSGTCTSTSSATVVINALTTSSFTYGTTNLDLNVANTSTNATSYSWNFGDLTSSTLMNPPTHTYAAAGTYIVELDATGPCGTIIYSQSITVTPAGINEASNIGRLIYYPNPASSTLTLDYEIVNDDDKTTIDIVNGLGQTIKSQNIGSSTNGIITADISDLTAGTYFIKFSNEKGNLVRHFIKE